MAHDGFPGVAKLAEWLESHDRSIASFAADAGLDGSQLAKVLKGRFRRPTVAFATAVERATGGAVTVADWAPECAVHGRTEGA